MYKLSPFTTGLCFITFFTGCAEKLDADHALESDLTGVWTIEHIHSDPISQIFTNTHYNVHIEDDGENIDISHCKSSENMHFVRGEHDLVDNNNQRLHIVNGSIIESIDVPNVVQLTKTSKTNFLNAGTITLNSGKFGSVYENEGVCAQRIIKSTDDAGIYHFQFSLPFENTYMEIDLEYYKISNSDSGNAVTNNIKSLTFSSPVFYQYYNSYSVETLNVHSELISVSSSSMKFDFDITTAQNSRFPDDNITGSIEVRY